MDARTEGTIKRAEVAAELLDAAAVRIATAGEASRDAAMRAELNYADAVRRFLATGGTQAEADAIDSRAVSEAIARRWW